MKTLFPRKNTLSFLLQIIFISVAFSQNNLQFLSGTTGAGCNSIKYHNNYVFTGTGSTLRSYYVGSGSTIPYQYNFEYRYKSQIIRMAIHNNYLWVCANYDGLTKWDISNPAFPVKVFEILPDSTGMATEGIGFKGDTLYLAQFSKMCAYKDNGTTYTKIGNFAYPILGSYITGVDVKNNICAVNFQHIGNQNGVKFYNASNFVLMSSYQQGLFLSENVVWGKNNNLLHVMSGTSMNVFAPNGLFYTLDVSDPYNPQKIYSDTILGFYLAAIALPYNAENINDTIYVSSWGGMKPNGPLDTLFIRAYDATNPSNIHRINYLPAGLWNFDMTIHYPNMYVASEWYGIQTVNISDMLHPTFTGRTLTGGWNLSADAWNNYMVVANEGYGFKLFDISNKTNPVLNNVNYDPGFCKRTRFSADGNYIYAAYDTYQAFRIYQRSNLTQVGYIQQNVCDGRFLVNATRIFSVLGSTLKIINVSNPALPVIDSTINMAVNDIAINLNNKLFISTNDSLFVYDVSGNAFSRIASVSLTTGQDAQKIAIYQNTLYSYVTNKGLVKYNLIFSNPGYSLVEEGTYTLTNGAPTLMAADTFGVYCDYLLQGLFAYDRQNLTQTGYFRTGLDYHRLTNQYGPRELFCKDHFIFLVEYFCQTSILSNDNNFYNVPEKSTENNSLVVFPNPANESITITMKNNNLISNITIHSLLGKEIQNFNHVSKTPTIIKINDLIPGIYVITVKDIAGQTYNSKIIKK